MGPNLGRLSGQYKIEVRDARTEDLIPVRSGMGLCQIEQMSARCGRRRHLEIQVDVQARKLYLEFVLWFGGRGERSWRMETGVLLRISIRIQ